MNKSFIKLSYFILIIMLYLQIIPQTVNANTTADGFIYEISGTEAFITGYEGSGGDIVIPETINIAGEIYTVTKIADHAFYNCNNLSGVVMPNSVLEIGIYAFSLCDNLERVVMSDNIEFISSSSFRHCSNLWNLKLGKNLIAIEENAFEDCFNLKELILPEKVHSILSRAFMNCTGLENIHLGNNLTVIGSSAFENCSNIIDLSIPDSVKYIGTSAFSGCSQINKIHIGNGLTTLSNSIFSDCSSVTSVIIPNNILNLESGVFGGCTSLESIYIGNSVTSIGNSAFSDCTSLSSIIIPNNVTSLGYNVFNNCIKLQNIILSENITEIGMYAFANCDSLTYIEIPQHVSCIETYTFFSCDKLENIIIPESVTIIESQAFNNCYNLKYIILPPNITTIESGAFLLCKSLENIVFPESLISIESSAFSWCTNLKNIKFFGNAPEGSSLFNGCDPNLKIIYPYGKSGFTTPLWQGYPTEAFYLVTYNGNGHTGGSVPIDDNAYLQSENVTVTLCNNTGDLSKEGHIFGGWNTKTDGSGITFLRGDTFNIEMDNITLYARWIPNTYIVTFNSQGGNNVANKTATYNNTIPEPTSPTKTGHTFGGWYKESAFTNKWNFATDKVTKNTTLYAKWTVNSYTVEFDSQGGSNVANKIATYNNTIPEPTTPTKTGHTFGGWYKESACTNEWNFDTDKVTENTILYAKWIENIFEGTNRVAGSTRYDTAAFISQTGWTGESESVIITSGEKFPDALAGSSFALQLNAPILLCKGNSMPSDTLAEIQRLNPKNIYILGGPATINESIKQELESCGYTVVRISDDSRFTTAIAIGEELRKYNQKSTAVITCAYKYPDALSFGPIAAKNNWPILFTDIDKLTGVTKDALINWGITEVKIIGGPASVSDTVKKELEQMGISVERIWGQDREDVSIEAAKKYNPTPEGVIITTGYKFADALTGGPLAGKFDYPILLVKEGSIKNEALTYIQNSGATKVVILGGEMSVNTSVRDQIQNIME